MSIISELTDIFTSKLGTDLFSKTGDFITGIAPIFSAGLSLYLLLLVFYYYNRGLDDAILDIFKRVIVWLIIIAFAFNAGTYTKLASFIYALPDDLSSLFGGEQTTASAVETGVQNVDKMVANIGLISEDANWYEWDVHLPVFGGQVGAYLMGYWLLLLAFAYYLITKVCLALTLMVGPLFLGAALFPGTRQFAMNWIGQCLNYTVTIVLFAIISKMQSEFVATHVSNWAGDNSTWDIVKLWDIMTQLIAMTILFTLVSLSVPSIAAALTGGAQADSHGRTVSRFVGGMRRMTGTMNFGRPGKANRAGKN
ncbi:type IV secretion system protein VirB6 [Advenella incenata]|uniref:Type IV secretion system protein VirB6 n=1 Tax=Advenella incenata TaxID=267800 RepID=A0A4Q7V4C4_9BURK|nr:type IV secretion system protein [Advenella incenata]RZT91055.1 type IV secretion system protein VirB6 [Advenella incenata]